jgi:ligand-binding SRPBCC domain-containing protein
MNLITVKSTINAPLSKVWDYWTTLQVMWRVVKNVS